MLQAPNISPWHTNINKLWILIIWSIQSCTSDEYFMGLIIDVWGINFVQSLVSVYLRHHFVYVPSQWEMALQCNAISHWLGKYTEWSLFPLGTLRLLCNMVVFSKYSLKTLHIPLRARYALYFVSLKCDFLPSVFVVICYVISCIIYHIIRSINCTIKSLQFFMFSPSCTLPGSWRMVSVK